jgi:hypothetical protein
MKWLLYTTNLSIALLGLRSQRLYFKQQQKLCELPFLYGEYKNSARKERKEQRKETAGRAGLSEML